MNDGLVDKGIENMPENIADVTVRVTVIPCGEPAQPEPPKPGDGLAVLLFSVIVACGEILLAQIALRTINDLAGTDLPTAMHVAAGVAGMIELGRLAFRPYKLF